MQSAFTKLNFPPIELKTRKNSDNNTLSVWVPTRRCYLVLTPEEWVRRHVVSFLSTRCGAMPTQICEEYAVNITGQPQRADVVVVDSECKPIILVECKAACIAIDQAVFAQAVRYNSVVNARYIILTNGLKHFCFERSDDGSYVPLKTFPKL
ncbi:MAG: type I restriction enzyme HsdR N-terminal domain-containing protein [Rikenellaceae bacterium]